jgi:hypothetical protein
MLRPLRTADRLSKAAQKPSAEQFFGCGALPRQSSNCWAVGRLASLLALCCLCAESILATTYTFTEKGPAPNTDNWSEAESWSPTDGPPGKGDTAIIGSATAGYTVNVDSSVTVANLTVINSTLQGGGALTVTGNLQTQFANLLPQGAITLNGTFSVTPLAPNAGATWFNTPITLNGSAAVYSNAALLFSAPVVFVNNGNFTLADGSQLGTAIAGGATFLNNARFYAGNATCTFGSSLFSNAATGIVSVNSGATLQMQGNTANSGNFQANGTITATAGLWATDGATFTGSGATLLLQGNHTLQGTVTVPGNLQLGSFSAGTPILTLNGTLEVPGGGNFNWLGGALTGVGSNLTGTVQVDTNGTMLINGLNTLTLKNCILTNNGTVIWTNNGTLFMGDNALIANAARFEVDADAIMGVLAGSSASFSNLGTFAKEYGASSPASTEIQVPFYGGGISGGIVGVYEGNLSFEAGGSVGSWNTASGASIQVTGGNYSIAPAFAAFDALDGVGGIIAWRAGATLNLANRRTLIIFAGNFNLSGGTIFGDGYIDVSGTRTSAVFNWTGGIISLTNPAAVLISSGGSTGTNSVMNIAGSGIYKTIKYGGIINNGIVNWVNDDAGGGVSAGDNFVFNNYGAFNIQCDSVFNDSSLVVHPILSNQITGVITKSAFTGTTTIGFKTVNLGLVQPQSGTLELFQFDDSLPSLADALTLDNGKVTFDNPTTFHGTIRGSGQITVLHGLTLEGTLNAGVVPVVGDLTNDGMVVVGDAPGLMTFANNYSQTTNGTLIIPVRGTNASTMDFGQLLVDGYSEINLAGTLVVEISEGYAPPVGATFPFMSSYQRNGTFDHLILPPGFALNYTPGGATLVVTGAAPVQILSPALANGQFQFGFNTISNRSYTIQYSDDLSADIWAFLTNFSGTGSFWQLSAPPPPVSSRFYRVSEP